MSENTLDELNIEILRNKLYKVTFLFTAPCVPIEFSVRSDCLSPAPAAGTRGVFGVYLRLGFPGLRVAERG